MIDAAILQEGIAFAIDGQAGWRSGIAERFPHDARNARSADATERAAEWVRSLEPDSVEFRHFRALLDMLADTQWEPRTAEEMVSAGDLTGRFFFDNRTTEPTVPDYRDLLDRLHTDTLRAYADAVDVTDPGYNQPPRRVVDYFAECGVTLFPADGDGE